MNEDSIMQIALTIAQYAIAGVAVIYVFVSVGDPIVNWMIWRG